MTKRLLFFILISILVFSGCSGGSGGGSVKNPVSNFGVIQGTVSFGMGASSLNISAISVKPDNFPIVPLRQIQYTRQTVPNEKIVKLRPCLSAAEAADIIAGLGGKIKKKLYGTESTYLITVDDQTFSKVTASRSSAIEYIEDNLKFQAFAIPNDKFFKPPYNWNYKMLNLEAAWDKQKGEDSSTEIIVAVLDTGIAPNHPDLAGNQIPGYDFIDDDPEPFDTEYGGTWASHGTHVAGIISAVTNNETGIAGVSWNVKIMPIRVLDSRGNGTAGALVEGINWAVNNGAKVINLSLGVTGPKPDDDDDTKSVRDAIKNAFNQGVTVIAAAGNDGIPTVAFPANCESVIAVAALDHTGAKASYSNYGSEIDFCAPGGGIPLTSNQLELGVKMVLSTCYDKETAENCYVFMSGTSMAAPHISGLAALLYAQNADITPDQVEARLKRCIDLGTSGPDNHFGHGLPDAYAVLTDTTPKMSQVKVFIGEPDGTIISHLQQVGASGDYTIADLDAGTYYVCAFKDENNNNSFDEGEPFGYRQVTLTENTLLIGVDITLPN